MIYLLRYPDFPSIPRGEGTKIYQHAEILRLVARFDAEGLVVGDIGSKSWFKALETFTSARARCVIDPYNGAPGGGPETIPPLPYPIVLYRCLVGPDSGIIPDAVFDVTLSISVIEHIGQPETGYDCSPLAVSHPVQDAIRDEFCEELFRITKPGGITIHTIDHAARNLSFAENFRRAGFVLFDPDRPVPTVEDCLNDPAAVRQTTQWTRPDLPMPEDEWPLHSVLCGLWRRPAS